MRNANGSGAYRQPAVRATLKAFPQWWNRRSADNGNVDEVAYVPPYRRTLNWAMRQEVQVVMRPDDTIPVR